MGFELPLELNPGSARNQTPEVSLPRLVLCRTGSVIFLSTCFLFLGSFSLSHLLTVLRRLQNLNPSKGSGF